MEWRGEGEDWELGNGNWVWAYEIRVASPLRSSGARMPAFALPLEGLALGHGFHDVSGIAVEGDLAGLFEGLERLDGGGDFHAVVGGLAVAAGEFAAVGAENEDDAVAAGAGVGRDAAVGVEGDEF
jgi:hypothetical protein